MSRLTTYLLPACAVLLLGAPALAAALEVVEPRCEYLENPLGIDVPRPRLSWKLVEADVRARGQRQTAYQVLVASDPALLARGKGDLWDSGRVRSDETAHVEYAGAPLRSGRVCWWKARAWDRAGRPSAWSAPARWSMGLLQPADWKGRWIGGPPPAGSRQFGDAQWIWYPEGSPTVSAPAGTRYFRREPVIPAGRRIKSAEISITADNSFTLTVNGEKACATPRNGSGEEWRTPVTADLARRLKAGPNVLLIAAVNDTPTPAGVVACLRVTFETGDPLVVFTDGSWLTTKDATAAGQSPVFAHEAWVQARALGRMGIEPWGDVGQGGSGGASPWLRKSFTLPAASARAFATVASVGYHELYVNGRKVGDNVLSPSISDLSQRVRYVTYDVTPYLQAGRNAVGLWLGTGWASFGAFHQANRPLVLAQLDITGADGKVTTVATDDTWRAHASMDAPTPGRGDFHGEVADAAADVPGWSAAGFDDSGWEPAHATDLKIKLSAEMIEPDRKVQEIRAVSVEPKGPGVFRVDMGRSFTGWIEARLHGAPGQRVRLSISERPDQAESFGQSSECLLDKNGRALFSNRFSYSAGRWVTFSGLDEAPEPADVKGYLVRTGYARAGDFRCSDPLLNRIYDTTLWTFECLSLNGYTVDCPHRERRGYGGDAHATMETALKNYGMGAFYTKWLGDWRDVQAANGDLPYTAPTYSGGGGPSWSGIIITLPWAVYQVYGDRRVLADNYPAMQRFLAFLETHTRENQLEKWGGVWDFLGDWVPPGKDQGSHRVDERSTLFYNNCYYVYVLRLASQTAGVLGKPDEAAAYARKADAIAAETHRRFFDPAKNTYANGDQLYLALPLLVGVTPAPLRPAVMKQLETEILVNKKGHVDTGIHGTYFLLKTLLAEDRNDLALAMATKKDYPSWGYMLEQGATTLWEQWDGQNSLLHSSFVSIGFWFLEGIAGIHPDPAAPGYKHFVIKPGIAGGLKWAEGAYDSIHGPIRSEWRLAGGKLSLDVTVPPNTTATVYVPAAGAAQVTESGRPASRAPGVRFAGMAKGAAVFEVGSGSYRFAAGKGK